MKAVYNKLVKAKEQIEVQIQKREDYVGNRSYDWQESEKCQDYEDRTAQLQETFEQLEYAIESLGEFQGL